MPSFGINQPSTTAAAARQACIAELADTLRVDPRAKPATLRAVADRCGMTETFFVEGVAAAVREYERANAPIRPRSHEQREQARTSRARNAAIYEEAKQRGVKPADLIQAQLSERKKLVALLDSWMVGTQRLGDCTKARLTAEAARCHATAAEMTGKATVYTKLAATMKDDDTVRTADRAAVLEILLAAQIV